MATEFYKAEDLKEMLGIALRSVYKLMQRPDFPAIKVSARRYVVPKDAFEKWINEQCHQKMEGI